MFCLFYIPRVRMGCWFEFKREKIFLGPYFGQLCLNSYKFTERRKNIIFYLNDDQFHPEILKEQKMSNFVLDFLPSNISQDIELNLKGE